MHPPQARIGRPSKASAAHRDSSAFAASRTSSSATIQAALRNLQDTKTFIKRYLSPLPPSLSLLVNIMFRMLQTDGCLLERQAFRKIEAVYGQICLQKHFGRAVQGAN